jgi:hypothetical protein
LFLKAFGFKRSVYFHTVCSAVYMYVYKSVSEPETDKTCLVHQVGFVSLRLHCGCRQLETPVQSFCTASLNFTSTFTAPDRLNTVVGCTGLSCILIFYVCLRSLPQMDIIANEEKLTLFTVIYLYIGAISDWFSIINLWNRNCLTLILLIWRIGWAPNSIPIYIQ